jgi:hypothetical protein
METYPDVLTGIPAILPLKYATQRAVLKTEYENGVEQRRLLWASHRRDVSLNYSVLPFALANELRRFYEARGGSFQMFNFFFPQIEVYTLELVGVVGSLAIGGFDLPSLGATSYTLYKNGSALTEGADWTFTAGTPPDIPDSVTLTTVGLPGETFHFDFTGRLRILARFGDNPFNITEIKDYLASFQVSLKGLEPQLNPGPL